MAGSGLLLAAGGADADNGNTQVPSSYDEKLDVNSFEYITSYNNFYEFGLDKSDPSNLSGKFKAKPWTVTVDG